MINIYRKPFPNGTEIHCNNGIILTISSDSPVAESSTCLYYNVTKKGSNRLFILKECFPITEKVTYYRDDMWQISPSIPDCEEATLFYNKCIAQVIREKQIGQIISRSSSRAIAAMEIVQASHIVIDEQCYHNNSDFILYDNFKNKGNFPDEVMAEYSTLLSFGIFQSSQNTKLCVITSLIIETLKALDEIHNAGYYYGNIRDSNLFFMNPNFKIGDVGVCHLLGFETAKKLCDDGFTEEISDQEIYGTFDF